MNISLIALTNSTSPTHIVNNPYLFFICHLYPLFSHILHFHHEFNPLYHLCSPRFIMSTNSSVIFLHYSLLPVVPSLLSTYCPSTLFPFNKQSIFYPLISLYKSSKNPTNPSSCFIINTLQIIFSPFLPLIDISYLTSIFITYSSLPYNSFTYNSPYPLLSPTCYEILMTEYKSSIHDSKKHAYSSPSLSKALLCFSSLFEPLYIYTVFPLPLFSILIFYLFILLYEF